MRFFPSRRAYACVSMLATCKIITVFTDPLGSFFLISARGQLRRGRSFVSTTLSTISCVKIVIRALADLRMSYIADARCTQWFNGSARAPNTNRSRVLDTEILKSSAT